MNGPTRFDGVVYTLTREEEAEFKRKWDENMRLRNIPGWI